MSPAIDIGIDFGTTNCTIGRMRADGRPVIHGPVPSVVAWSNGETRFGFEAKEWLATGGGDVFAIRDLKLLLGREDPRAGRETLDAVGLVTDLLRHLKKALLREDDEVGTAVIGTPIRMTRSHRVKLRQAAANAGFATARFVYEPTAALIGELNEVQRATRSHTLVVDWGGGTLDLAVVRNEEGSFRELAVGGDVKDLGGSEIDEALTRALLEQNPAIRARIDATDGLFERLKEDVESEKISILESFEGRTGETRVWAPAWLDDIVEMDPSSVFETLEDFARRARDRLAWMLANAGLKTEDVSAILFAGGICKCGVVREILSSDFPNADVLSASDPQVQTGYGCTILTGQEYGVELAADFGVRQADDTVCVLLPRGQAVETDRYRQATFMLTDVDAPEAVFDFGVCHFDAERESLSAADANNFQSLKKVWVVAGPPQTSGGRGVPDVVKLHCGVDGNLTVAVNLQSANGGDEKQEFISGIPLSIKVNG